MFTQRYLIAVNPPVYQGNEVFLSWDSDAPEGTYNQVYINQILAWNGVENSTWVPYPTQAERIDIGAVVSGFGEDGFGDYGFDSAAGMEEVSFLSGLPSPPLNQAYLMWQGGTFEDPDLSGFYVYGSDSPGGPIDYTTVIGTVTAYPNGVSTDGFGLGAFGGGAFGESETDYSWTSAALASGVWSFAVIAFDSSNNLGAGQIVSLTIAVPPVEPPVYPGTNTRLRYTLLAFGQTPFGTAGFGEPEAVLNWNPSTG